MDKKKLTSKSLDDEQLEQVNGGALYNNWEAKGKNWEVIDEIGNVVESFYTREEALRYAGGLNPMGKEYSTNELQRDELEQLRHPEY